MEDIGRKGPEASESDRKSLSGREDEQSQSAPIPPDPLAGRKSSGGPACHHEPRKVHAGSRPYRLEDSATKEGRPDVVETQALPCPAASPRLHSQKERQAPAAGHPHHERPGDAGASPHGPPANLGGDSGPELLWVPSLPLHSGCDRGVLHLPFTPLGPGMGA